VRPADAAREAARTRPNGARRPRAVLRGAAEPRRRWRPDG
jgi:hypothetical protein